MPGRLIHTVAVMLTHPSMKLRVLAALSLACVAAYAFAQSPKTTLPPDLVRALQAFDRAQVDADTAALARLVTEDYVLVNSDATVDLKPKYLSDFLLPGLKMDPYVIEQRIEKVLGDAAVITGVQRLSWTQDGTRQRRVLRIVHVWTRHDGHWRATHTQLTRIPDKAPTRTF